MQTTRPIMNPDATSPYQRYGKHPYHYPEWAHKPAKDRGMPYRTPIPQGIQNELDVARKIAAERVEQQIAQLQRRQRAFEQDDPFAPPPSQSSATTSVDVSGSTRWAHPNRFVRADRTRPDNGLCTGFSRPQRTRAPRAAMAHR